MSESPPPAEDPVDRATVDESESDTQRGDVDRRRSGNGPRRRRTRRVRKAGSDGCLFDARFDDDEFVVTADVPGTSKDDLSIGIDPKTNDLVIGKNGTVLERVSLPWQSPEATRVWFNNGVLEVRVRPADP
ncbi:Hsp20/alpha crystallin family protein [Halorarum salinum]|uniref:Hsp20/alpha crystallin family protein n=1 Tax=Halorarum salinum TaxID=2743089 RepID=UPI001FE72A03|nr:Hsp20/alpha crystallin family protein [Halobaculum salinum]